jgi:hypothetical protein
VHEDMSLGCIGAAVNLKLHTVTVGS